MEWMNMGMDSFIPARIRANNFLRSSVERSSVLELGADWSIFPDISRLRFEDWRFLKLLVVELEWLHKGVLKRAAHPASRLRKSDAFWEEGVFGCNGSVSSSILLYDIGPLLSTRLIEFCFDKIQSPLFLKLLAAVRGPESASGDLEISLPRRDRISLCLFENPNSLPNLKSPKQLNKLTTSGLPTSKVRSHTNCQLLL